MNIVIDIKKQNYSKEKMSNGTVAFQNVRLNYSGKYTFVGKYLHYIFAGLTKEEMAVFEKELTIDLHKTLKCFYQEYNGIDLFSGSLSIYGFGRIKSNGVYLTSRDPLMPTPFHMFDENNGYIDQNRMKIGSVCETPLYANNFDGQITRKDRNGIDIENWKGIEECIEDLYFRLKPHYDNNGICIDPIIINKLFFNKVKEI